jgi:ketosteroid isomerase-like protein
MCIPPKEYSTAVERQKTCRFNENDIRSFVYHVFALYDKRVDVNQFLPFLAEDDLEMRFPNKPVISSYPYFEEWYNGIHKDYESNLHLVERIDVMFLENCEYEVDLTVVWQAQPKQGNFEEMRFHQAWTLVDDESQSEWPKILRYVVEIVPSGDIWKRYVDYLKRKCVDEWCALWQDTGQFVVQYGEESDKPPEKYGKRQAVDLRDFMFGKVDRIKDIDVENSAIYQTIDPNVFFVSFDFKAKTKNGHKYENHILVQVTLEQGKIKELIEYADPRPRGFFLEALR